MDILLLLKAAILGVVEGITEFLPVSSTGHLILAGQLLEFNDAKGKVFEITIQLAATLAVVWAYKERVVQVTTGLHKDPVAQRLVINVAIAFVPLAALGLLFIEEIKEYLFSPLVVAAALIIGGFLMLWVERRQHVVHAQEVDDMSWKDALKVGLAQALALIPGTSRSAATIVGGIYFGMSRKAATEFSFFLAIPTMFAATFYDIYKYRDLFSWSDLPMFLVGSITAYISALACVRWLIDFVSKHDFSPFAWYRIIFGVLVLITYYFGWVNWTP